MPERNRHIEAELAERSLEGIHSDDRRRHERRERKVMPTF